MPTSVFEQDDDDNDDDDDDDGDAAPQTVHMIMMTPRPTTMRALRC